MRRLVAVMFLAVAACLITPSEVRSSPIRQWDAFPGWDVRVIPLRGYEMGGEPRLSVVQGGDGFVYLIGALSEYRVLDLQGRYEKIASLAPCRDRDSSVSVEGYGVPRILCGAGLRIAVAGGPKVVYNSVPRPVQPSQNLADAAGAAVSKAFADGAGGYWFTYTSGQGIGRVSASGRAVAARAPSFGYAQTGLALHNDFYVTDERCRIAHFGGFARFVDLRAYACNGIRADESLIADPHYGYWRLDRSGSALERYFSHGRIERWPLSLPPLALTVSRDGTPWVIGSKDGGRSQFFVVTLTGGRISSPRPVSLTSFGSMSFDRRGRLWITMPLSHSVAVLIPPGRSQT